MLALLGAATTALLRSFRPELALIAAAISGMAVLLMVMGELSGVFDTLRAAAASFGINDGSFGALVKIVGVACLAQFGADVCRDAGESGIATRVEFCGRVLIVACAMPIAIATLREATDLLRGAP